MLGEAFYKIFSNEFTTRFTDIDVNEVWLSKMDIRSYEDYYLDVKKFRSNYLFHLGAYTDLEYCERNPDQAYITNTLAVEYAVKIANELNIPLLYISSAGIFDGKKQVYDDWDAPNPLNHYGRSKYLGELYVKENCKYYIICRPGWMMGSGSKKDKKFVNKILAQIQNGSKEINVVDDKFGTPTYTVDFAKNVKLILKEKFWGVYNLVCDGTTNRYEVAKEILRITGLESKIKLNTVGSEFWKKEYFAPRPYSEQLDSKKLKSIKLYIMRDWKICLREYLEEYFNDRFIKK